jgi:hypothetical protein
MTDTAPPASTSIGRILAAIMVPILVVLLGIVGVVCIDQGRSAADTVAAMADQSRRLDDAALGVASARHLAAAGRAADAAKALDAAEDSVRAAAAAEDTASRREKIEATLPLAAALRAALADSGRREAAGAALAEALAGSAGLAGQDLAEAEAEVPAEVLQTAALFGVFALMLAAAAGFAAYVAVRVRPAA